jgi:uncharacterized protein YkwD
MASAQRRLVTLLIAAIAAGASCVSLPVDALAATRPCSTTSGLQPAKRILCLINAERAARGRAALRLDLRLTQTARRHSIDMVTRRYFAHDSPSGQSPAGRVRLTGWLHGRGRWLVGENLAWGSGSRGAPDAIVSAWMHSPGHRRVLLDPRFCSVGIGVITGTPRAGIPQGATYTADFGSGSWTPGRARRPGGWRCPG